MGYCVRTWAKNVALIVFGNRRIGGVTPIKLFSHPGHQVGMNRTLHDGLEQTVVPFILGFSLARNGY